MKKKIGQLLDRNELKAVTGGFATRVNCGRLKCGLLWNNCKYWGCSGCNLTGWMCLD